MSRTSEAHQAHLAQIGEVVSHDIVPALHAAVEGHILMAPLKVCISQPCAPVEVIEETGQPADHDLVIRPCRRELREKSEPRFLFLDALKYLQNNCLSEGMVASENYSPVSEGEHTVPVK